MKFPDVNLLVAMTRTDHAHHGRAEAWRSNNPKFVTCPMTELGLLRVLLATGTAVEIAETAFITFTATAPRPPAMASAMRISRSSAIRFSRSSLSWSRQSRACAGSCRCGNCNGNGHRCRD